jgi:hypothetical protein
MSVSTVFLNKAIFRIHKFKFPATLVAGQMAFTLLAVVVLQQVGVVRRFNFSMPHFKRVSPSRQPCVCPFPWRTYALRGVGRESCRELELVGRNANRRM